MPQMRDLESDIEALDEFLMSDQTPEDCMMLCDLDGFLTGIAIGPELVLPSEWLPVIWGDEEPVFDSGAQAQAILGTIMKRYNEILAQVADGAVAPIFMETPGGDVIAADWAEGFRQAIPLRHDAWEKLFKSEKHSHTLVPILALCCNDDGDSLLGLPEEANNRFFEDAGELIPPCILEIAEFWRAARSAPQRQSTGPKVGRNDPCPAARARNLKNVAVLTPDYRSRGPHRMLTLSQRKEQAEVVPGVAEDGIDAIAALADQEVSAKPTVSIPYRTLPACLRSILPVTCSSLGAPTFCAPRSSRCTRSPR